MKSSITVVVNGVSRTSTVEARRTLADFLREDLFLTGTRIGCEHGACGSCTILVDGEPSRACLMLAVQAQGREIVTIEGLAEGDAWHLVQEAIRAAHAFQCGYCTSGFIVSIVALLEESAEGLTRDEIRRQLSGNLCRCSGYQTIVDVVETLAGASAEASND